MTGAAQVLSKDDLIKINSAADTFRKNQPIEKLYLQFDKPYYSVGDTIWFKAYLFNASYFGPPDKSGLFYIELANDSNKVITRMMLPLANGLSWGNIVLNEKDIPKGTIPCGPTPTGCAILVKIIFLKRIFILAAFLKTPGW